MHCIILSPQVQDSMAAKVNIQVYYANTSNKSISKPTNNDSIELDIDLNGKIFDPAYDGWTAFHLACFFGKTDIVKIMIDNSESLKLDLTAKDKNKQTGFQLAQRNKQQRVVLLLHWNNIK